MRPPSTRDIVAPLTARGARRILKLMTKAVIVTAAALGLFACGCSSFNRDWKAAGKVPAPPGLGGRWEGTWKSEVNGHNGNLRCLISPTSPTNHYDALFHAKYLKMFSFTYPVELTATNAGNIFHFTGSADLGAAGGVFHYDGTADAARFLATYSSKKDHGTFEMLKVPTP
jgi:hypothetical protein